MSLFSGEMCEGGKKEICPAVGAENEERIASTRSNAAQISLL